MNDLDPATALATVSQSRAALAERVITPVWYHPILGLAIGLFFASYGTHNWWVITPAEALLFVVCFVLRAAYRRITGVWMSGYRRGRTRPATFTLLAILVALPVGAAVLDEHAHVHWAWYAAGALAVPSVIVFGRWFDELLRAELRAAL